MFKNGIKNAAARYHRPSGALCAKSIALSQVLCYVQHDWPNWNLKDSKTVSTVLLLQIGRPRPSFLARCFPAASDTIFEAVPISSVTQPSCTNEDQGDIDNAYKSFCSGHASYAASSGMYLTLFLMHILQVFSAPAPAAHAVIALVPVSLGIWVGLTRISDCVLLLCFLLACHCVLLHLIYRAGRAAFTVVLCCCNVMVIVLDFPKSEVVPLFSLLPCVALSCSSHIHRCKVPGL